MITCHQYLGTGKSSNESNLQSSVRSRLTFMKASLTTSEKCKLFFKMFVPYVNIRRNPKNEKKEVRSLPRYPRNTSQKLLISWLSPRKFYFLAITDQKDLAREALRVNWVAKMVVKVVQEDFSIIRASCSHFWWVPFFAEDSVFTYIVTPVANPLGGRRGKFFKIDTSILLQITFPGLAQTVIL